MREISLREDQDTIDLTGKYQLGSAYLQLAGEQAQNPCVQCRAGKGPFELCVYVAGTAKCGNCCYRGSGTRCVSNTGEENNTGLSKNLQDRQAEDSAVASESDSRKKETDNLAAPLFEGANPQPHYANNSASRPDTETVSGLLPNAGIGAGLENHPEPEPGYTKGGRELRPRPRRRTVGGKRPPQSEQNHGVTEPVTVGPNQRPQARRGNPDGSANPTSNTNTNTNTNPPTNPPDSPSIRSGIDTPLSPQSGRATPVVQASRNRGESEMTPPTSDISFSSLGSPHAVSPKPVLDCLPRNTSVEILRCLMEYYQNQAVELDLEVEDIAASRARMVLWHPEPEGGRDSKNRNKDRNGGSGSGAGGGAISGNADDYSTIRACIGLGQTPLETMHCVSLHYQYQAHKLRLELARIERGEKARIQREEREMRHQLERERRRREREREREKE